jgi:hypothetical protein
LNDWTSLWWLSVAHNNIESVVSCYKGQTKGRISERVIQIVAGIESVMTAGRSKDYIRLQSSDGKRPSPWVHGAAKLPLLPCFWLRGLDESIDAAFIDNPTRVPPL